MTPVMALWLTSSTLRKAGTLAKTARCLRVGGGCAVQCNAMTSDKQEEQWLRLRGRADTYSRLGMANKPDGRVPDSELPCNVSDLYSRSKEPK